MNTEITGTVRIDLASTADDVWASGEHLSVDAAAYVEIWRAMQGADETFTFELWIGAARTVTWIDQRCGELLGQAQRVVFVGSDPRGVEDAVRGLRRLIGGAAA